jgi:hypothetical protein
MTIKERLILDLKEIGNPKLLYQVFDFLSLLKRNIEHSEGNLPAVLACAGTLPDHDAVDITKTVNEEFNSIEGDW